MTDDRGTETAREALRVAFGVVPFLAGLDKFFNLLADWPRYVSPLAEAILPVAPQTFMYVAGVVEMAVGIAILTRWTVPAAYVAAGWLVLVALNLLAAGFLDVAVRDLVMATAAYALARLTEAREAAHAEAVGRPEAARIGRVA